MTVTVMVMNIKAVIFDSMGALAFTYTYLHICKYKYTHTCTHIYIYIYIYVCDPTFHGTPPQLDP